MEKEDKQIFVIKIIIGILTLLTIGLIILQFVIEITTTEFALNGEESIVLEVGEEYKEEGFTATSNKKDIKNKVTIKSNVNTSKIGKYTVTYNLKIGYLNVDKTLTRTVEVKDTTKPKLVVNSEKELKVYIGDTFNYPTYSAVDAYDGDITNNVKVDSNLDLNTEGTYSINYSVKDSSNNESTDKIVVNVEVKRKNAYVDISISDQALYYYEYGEVVLYSDIVTGINDGTPTGNFKVVNKARNVNLRGEDYVSFVNYWIAFYGGVYGMHDASWRSYFGGTIYKTNGSHGCVNMPYYKVQALYNMVEIGTPVYIHY